MSDEAKPMLVQQGELTEQIAGLLPTQVKGPWTSLVFSDRSLATYGEDTLVVYRPDGTADETQAPPRQISKLVMKLRKVMYRPGAGTWLSAQWTITNHGDSIASSAAFNYDDEPEWFEPIEPEHYALDLEDFPRDAGSIPPWLQERVAQARVNAPTP